MVAELVMAELLTPAELAAAKGAPDVTRGDGRALDPIVEPTAEELLALTEEALTDVAPQLALTGPQRTLVRTALRARLTRFLAGEEA
jgi:hypothetical protein